jgi:hypothetical protein
VRKRTLFAAGAALSLTLVLPGAASAQTSPPLVWTAPIPVEHPPFATGECTITAPAPGTYHVNASYLGQSPYGPGQAAGSVPVKVSAHGVRASLND